MNDLISRREAIDRAVPVELFGRKVMFVAVSELEMLSSAQQEQEWSGLYSEPEEDDFCSFAERRKMKPLEDLTLTERVKLYADGNKEVGLPAHGFDFSHEDAEHIMGALRIVWLLSRAETAHNYQAEREDLKSFCIVANGIIRTAKRFVEKCPLKAEFRMEGEKNG